MVTGDNLEEIEEKMFSFIVALKREQIKRLEGMPWEFLKTIREDNLGEKKQRYKFYNERTY